MFPYLNTVKDFINDCKDVESECKEKNRCSDCTKCKLVKELEESVNFSNYCGKKPVDYRQIRSWCNSVAFYLKKELEQLVKADRKYSKLAIGFEYYLETRAGFIKGENPHVRVDVMIGGYDHSGKMTVMIIELKQWSKIIQISEDFKEWIYEYDKNKYPEENPITQVSSYANNINKSIKNNNLIRFVPCVYMHNIEDISIISKEKITNIDNKGYFVDNNSRIRVYYGFSPKKAGKGLYRYIKEIFDTTNSNNLEVFRELKKSYHVLSQKELANYLICNEKQRKKYEHYLRPDQYGNFFGYSGGNYKWDNYILKHIDYFTFFKINGNKEKWIRGGMIDFVEGGPGSGKTFLAMIILRYCLEKGLNVAYVYASSAPVNAVFGDLAKQLSADLEIEVKDSFSDLIKKTSKKKLPDKYLLFKGENKFDIIYFSDINKNQNQKYDVYIFDEAHRLTGEKSKLDFLKKDKKIAFFFYDKRQVIEENTIIDEKTLRRYSMQDRSIISTSNVFNVWSQFRCGKDDRYLVAIDYALGIRKTINCKNAQNDFDVVIENDKSVKKLAKSIRRSKTNKILVLSVGDSKEKGFLSLLGNVLDIDKIHIWGTGDGFKGEKNGQMESSHDDGETINIGLPHNVQGVETKESLVIIRHSYDEIKKDIILQNKYRILLTRALHKCHIYCIDPIVKERFKKAGIPYCEN